MVNQQNLRKEIHLLFPFPEPEEDGYAGIVLILSKQKAELLAEAVRDASLLMTNRKFFATKSQWLNIDIDNHCEEAILIDNTRQGNEFVLLNFNTDISKPFFIENLSDLRSVKAESHPGDYDWSLFIGTSYGGGIPFLQFILESNVGLNRVNGDSINTNFFEVEEFLNSLDKSLNDEDFPEIFTED